MVEISDSGNEKLLRQRVTDLTRDADEMERRHKKSLDVFRSTVAVLAMTAADLSPRALDSLDILKRAASQEPFDGEALNKALEGFRQAIMLAPDLKPAQPEAVEAGRHVAMALLSGLHSGDEAFDAKLERNITQISDHISAGKIRPAMAVVADVMDEFREVVETRRQMAESALHLVLEELLKTEDELAAAMVEVSGKLRQSGQEADKNITASAGKLAKQISEAHPDGKGLEALKSSILEHVRSLRESLKARRERELEILDQTQCEVNDLREALLSTRRQVAETKKKSELFSRQALTDPITHMLNKRALSRDLRQALEDRRTRPVSLVVFDIDYFKAVNDNFGHQAGDKALRTIAEQASATLRPTDTLFRYAGDEFVILLRKTDLETAKHIAERVRKAAAAIKFTYRGGQEHNVTISMGVSQAKSKDTSDGLFERADEALLKAKREGRNRVQAN